MAEELRRRRRRLCSRISLPQLADWHPELRILVFFSKLCQIQRRPLLISVKSDPLLGFLNVITRTFEGQEDDAHGKGRTLRDS